MMLNNTSSNDDRVIEKARDFGSTLKDLLDILENLDESLSEANKRIDEYVDIIKDNEQQIRILEARVAELENLNDN